MYSTTRDFFIDCTRPFGERMVVISDSEYKRRQQAQVEEQIKVIEERADLYRKCLETAEASIAELRKSLEEIDESED